MAKRTMLKLAAASLAASVVSAAWATKMVTYTYDAKGRLVTIERKDDVINNDTAEYKHDKADNRTHVMVTGSPKPPPP